jgi:hypothetical protein
MRMMTRAVLALLVALAATLPARAQSPAPGASGVRPDQAAPDQPAPQVDAAKLGVSMSRIQKGLRLSEARERSSAATSLKLEYQVQVYGAAPRIDILQDFNVGPNAPLSYGAPTHSDFIRQWTPQAYRSPRWPLGALAGWAISQAVTRGDKAKCEEEIARYRALVMQGTPAPAPRCTQ